MQEEFNIYLLFVGSLFNLVWLGQSSPDRLKALWRRTDKLAKVEVAYLGFFIKRLQTEHKKWLGNTARSIREQAPSPHGSIFQIVTLGSIVARETNVRPMSTNYPGYDAELLSQDEHTFRVSIKNHDVSTHEEQFRSYSARLAKIVRRRVIAFGVGWQAVVRSHTYLDTPSKTNQSAIRRHAPPWIKCRGSNTRHRSAGGKMPCSLTPAWA